MIMRKPIRASKVDTFMKYHEDESNYRSHPEAFDRVYNILDKYDTSNGNDSVDVVFLKATPADQDRMIELITPRPSHVGQPGYVKRLYEYAEDPRSSRDTFFEDLSRDYCEGVVDTITALIEEGLLDASYFD